jgi:predicted ribosome quality control (RQC) complex YloA/Tae2 family protein
MMNTSLGAYLSSLLAEVYAHAGQLEQALHECDAALSQMENPSEHFYEAELYRLKGELIFQQFNVQR